MLFIDEAYTLVRGSGTTSGTRRSTTLVKLMEDHRDRVVLVVAGYPQEMEAFCRPTPGCGPVSDRIEFPDYRTDLNVHHLDSIRREVDYDCRRRTAELHSVLEAAPRTKGFGNAARRSQPLRGRHQPPRLRVVKLAERTDDVLTP